MKKAFHPRALTAMTTLLAAALVALWLGCMYCLTSVTAEYAANRYLRNHSDRATQLSVYAMLSEVFSFGFSCLMALIAGKSLLSPFVLSSGMCGAGILLFLICYRNVRTLEN